MAPSLRKLAVEDPVEGVLLKRRIVKGLEGSAWQNRVSIIPSEGSDTVLGFQHLREDWSSHLLGEIVVPRGSQS